VTFSPFLPEWREDLFAKLIAGIVTGFTSALITLMLAADSGPVGGPSEGMQFLAIGLLACVPMVGLSARSVRGAWANGVSINAAVCAIIPILAGSPHALLFGLCNAALLALIAMILLSTPSGDVRRGTAWRGLGYHGIDRPFARGRSLGGRPSV
jgi:peptidoglycan/LPS O-acetylase OafA/YrhL